MIIATTIAQVRAQVAAWKKEGLTVGLVPTMGYLHEGHASLVDEAVRQCDRVVASDFVNPTQFGPNEDLEAYPRDFDRDCALLEEHGCAMVFHPAVEEMYAPGAATYVEILSDMPKQLCGKTRPIHFRGVCTVVLKLFMLVTPDKAFFGQRMRSSWPSSARWCGTCPTASRSWAAPSSARPTAWPSPLGTPI